MPRQRRTVLTFSDPGNTKVIVQRSVRNQGSEAMRTTEEAPKRKASAEVQRTVYEVRKIDGIYYVETEPGDTVPIKTEGGALLGAPGTCGDGWEPEFVYAGLFPVHVLEWRHLHGDQGSWYLDADMRAIGGSHREPPSEAVAIIREKARELVAELWDGLLSALDPAVAPCLASTFASTRPKSTRNRYRTLSAGPVSSYRSLALRRCAAMIGRCRYLTAGASSSAGRSCCSEFYKKSPRY